MDLDGLRYHEAATKLGLSLWRHGNDSWSLGPPPATEPLQPGRPVQVSETFISEDRVRLADGRIFKREMTTAELRVALGLEDAPAG
jgi:hypothetical protein